MRLSVIIGGCTDCKILLCTFLLCLLILKAKSQNKFPNVFCVPACAAKFGFIIFPIGIPDANLATALDGISETDTGCMVRPLWSVILNIK